MAILTGSVGNDTIQGTDDADVISGLGGNDILKGLAGDDTLLGGAGDDILAGNAGVNEMNGGTGNDIYQAVNSDDIIVELPGQGIDTARCLFSFDMSTHAAGVENLVLIDNAIGSAVDAVGNTLSNVMMGNEGDNVLRGGAGNDTLIGAGGDDTLQGEDGNDVLDGGNGNDTMSGGAGNDTYIADNRDDAVVEATGGGKDLVLTRGDYFLAAGQEIEALTLTGSRGAILFGNEFANIITGGIGNDFIDGDGGNDTLIGGAGDDTYAIGRVPTDLGNSKIVETANGGHDTVISALHDYTLAANVENLALDSPEANLKEVTVTAVNGTGNALNNEIQGNEIANRLDGGAGNDALDGGKGDDTLIGGTGNDAYFITAGQGSDTIVEKAGGGDDIVFTDLASYTLDANVEFLVLTAAGSQTGIGNVLNNAIAAGNDDDTLRGLDGNDALFGNGGNDTLEGGAGIDELVGGEGNDQMSGGAGNDTYHVDSEDDGIVEAVGGGKDLVVTTTSYILAAGQEIEAITMEGTDGIGVLGNEFNNVITGNASDNFLLGGGGSDTLIGGDGDDTYIIGRDTADKGNDKVVEAANGGDHDFVISNLHDYTLGANVEDLLLDSPNASLAAVVTAINGTGNALNNDIRGNEIANRLDGAAGNDTLDGGFGDDTLVGGTGDDTYLINRDDGADTILENAGGGTDTVVTDLISFTLAANVENLILENDGNATGTGNNLGNRITGADGNDTLKGLDGNDILDGGLHGDDRLEGGAGNDTYILHLSNAAIIVETDDKTSGIDTVRSADIPLELLDFGGENVENIILDDFASKQGRDLDAFGNDLANIIIGNSGANHLAGGAGNDTLAGGLGDDTYFLDTGDDKDKVIEALNAGHDTVISNLHDYTLAANVEDLFLDAAAALTADAGGVNGTGNTLDNRIVGSSDANRLDGGAGDDLLSGRGGDDVILGGTGNDFLDGEQGADQMAGGTGNDIYLVRDTTDSIVELAGQGIDTVQTQLGSHTLAGKMGENVENLTYIGTGNFTGIGNKLNNIIHGNVGDDVLQGLEGNDTLDGSIEGHDRLEGGAGNDIYILRTGGDYEIVEAAGKAGGIDTIETRDLDIDLDSDPNIVNVENVTLQDFNPGQGKNLHLFGNFLDNILTGNSGENTLYGGGGNDTLIGGAGNDTYILDDKNEKIVETATGGHDTVESHLLDYTLAANVEDLVLADINSPMKGTGNALDNGLFGSHFADTFDGAAGNDAISGGSGDDILIGGSGDDFLGGGVDKDTLTGGTGNDTYLLDGGDDVDVIVEAANGGVDTVLTFLTEYTLGANIENLIYDSGQKFTGTGNSLNNTILGGFGEDILKGLDGNDTLDGGDGTNRLEGGAGNDVYILHTTDISQIVEDAGKGIDTVRSSERSIDLNVLLLDNIENVTLDDFAFHAGRNFSAFGNALANVITGNSGNNVLDGNDGNDTLIGGLGDDEYFIDVGDEKDKVVEAAGGGHDFVVSALHDYTLTANVEDLVLNGRSAAANGTGNILDNDILGNGEDNRLDGAAGNDILNGQSGIDTLLGGAGSDRLEGGLDADILTGGAGSDVFVYRHENNDALSLLGGDTITDFQSGNDKIDVRDLFDDFGLDHGSDPFADGHLVLQADGLGNTLVQFEPILGGSAVVLATVLHATVVETDIVF